MKKFEEVVVEETLPLEEYKKMTLARLLKKNDITIGDFTYYIQYQGIDKISTKELNKIVEVFGIQALMIANFIEYYSIISSNESNKIMVKWTKAIGYLTIFVAAATIIMLFKP